MKHIVKNKEPNSLIQHRLWEGAEYSNCPQNVKHELQEALLKEQGYICCYCMQRIERDKMRIEHWQPQSRYPEKQLDYRNLLAACQGNKGQEEYEHCDRRKKDAEISINPLKKTCETLIKYDKTGQIYSEDSIIDKELNEKLNLNLKVLTKNRKIALERIIQNFDKKYHDKSWSVYSIEREIERYSNLNKQGKYEPYCQYIVYFLRKRLNRARSQQKSGE